MHVFTHCAWALKTCQKFKDSPPRPSFFKSNPQANFVNSPTKLAGMPTVPPPPPPPPYKPTLPPASALPDVLRPSEDGPQQHSTFFQSRGDYTNMKMAPFFALSNFFPAAPKIQNILARKFSLLKILKRKRPPFYTFPLGNRYDPRHQKNVALIPIF